MLAVLILRLWPAIVAGGVMALIGTVVVAIVLAAWHRLQAHEVLYEMLLTVGTVAIMFTVGLVVAQLIAKRSVLTTGEAGAFLVMTFMLLSATLVFGKIALQVTGETQDLLPLLMLLPVVILWAWLFVHLTRVVKKRKATLLESAETPNVVQTTWRRVGSRQRLGGQAFE